VPRDAADQSTSSLSSIILTTTDVTLCAEAAALASIDNVPQTRRAWPLTRGSPAKAPSWWPLVKRRARLSAASGHYGRPVNRVRWTDVQKVSASVIDQSYVRQTWHRVKTLQHSC